MTLLDMKLSEMQQACIDLGIDASFDGKHYATVLEMFWEGHTAEEIKEWIEVEQDRDHYAYIPEL